MKLVDYDICLHFGAYQFPNDSVYINSLDDFPACNFDQNISESEELCEDINIQHKVDDNFDVRCSCPSSYQRQLYYWYLLMLMFLIPTTIISICYTQIIIQVRTVSKMFQQSPHSVRHTIRSPYTRNSYTSCNTKKLDSKTRIKEWVKRLYIISNHKIASFS